MQKLAYGCRNNGIRKPSTAPNQAVSTAVPHKVLHAKSPGPRQHRRGPGV